jgi:hypothetical protein
MWSISATTYLTCIPTLGLLSSKFNFLTDLLCPFGVHILVVGGDVTKHQNPAIAQGVCLGDAPDNKRGVLTLLPRDNRPVVRRGLRGMPYSKDWIAYMNAWANQKPLKPTDGSFVFKSTMEYSETGITGDVKDLPHTATKAFIDIGLTNGVLQILSPLMVPSLQYVPRRPLISLSFQYQSVILLL